MTKKRLKLKDYLNQFKFILIQLDQISSQQLVFSFAEIADIISEITGTTIAYNQTEVIAYVAQFVQLGVSEDDAAYLARFAGAIDRGEFDTNKSDVKQLLGRSPISLKFF